MTYIKIPIKTTETTFAGDSVKTDYFYPDFGSIKLRQLGLNPEKTESIFEIIEGDPTQISGAIEMTKEAANIELESWRPAELEPLGGEI